MKHYIKRTKYSISLHLLYIIGAVSVGFVGCNPTSFIEKFAGTFGDPIVIEKVDKTPPKVKLVIPDLGNGVLTVDESTNEPVQITVKNSSFYIVAIAEDAEGVQEVSIGGTIVTQCYETNVGIPLIQSTTNSDNSKVGETGLTKRWVPFLIEPTDFCSGFGGFEEIKFSFQAFGSNFSGLQSSTQVVTIILVE